jgi:catechol 2,3-dioxygenase-like lactoylglutathione lyase family enzyme
MTNEPQFGSVFLVVDDIARSLTFYEHLGLEFPPEAFSGQRFEVELPNGTRIAWFTREFVSHYAPDYEPAPYGRVGLSFRLASPAGVDALFERLGSLGHRVDRTPWDAPTSFRYAIVFDPDGNPVHIYSPLPDP